MNLMNLQVGSAERNKTTSQSLAGRVEGFCLDAAV